jgi:integrase
VQKKLTPRENVDHDEIRSAAVRENTQKSLDSAVRHFERRFSGQLPATAPMMELYAQWCVEQGYAMTTIAQRLTLLARWHREQGFPDPTTDKSLRDYMKGSRRKFSRAPKKASPLTMAHIQQVVEHCDREITKATAVLEETDNKAEMREAFRAQLTALRDKAFFLVGFWFAFRSDELVRLDFESISFEVGQAHDDGKPCQEMQISIGSSKGDRESEGRQWRVKELLELCPVNAMLDWQKALGVINGPVFVKISRWGRFSNEPLHVNSVVTLMRKALERAGIDGANFSSHSLRRGFANFAIAEEMSEKDVMSWVKWTDQRTLHGYIDDSSNLPSKLMDKVRRKRVSLQSDSTRKLQPRQ